MSRPEVIRVPLSRERILLRHHPPDPLVRVRDRLFRAAFIKFSAIYARFTTPLERKILEFLLLAMALLSLICLVYVHTVFLRNPSECLAGTKGSWPRDGILRIEVVPVDVHEEYSLEESYIREGLLRQLEEEDGFSYVLHSESFFMNDSPEQAKVEEKEIAVSVNNSFLIEGNNTGQDSTQVHAFMFQLAYSRENAHILEFSLEHGFLKLGPEVRKRLNIPVHLVILDPDDTTCFGGMLNKFIVHYVLGYDDVLLQSLKLLAEKENYKGYVRNIVTGSEYVFVNIWMDQKSYVTAALVMLLFTCSVSILLRHSHHQIFVFIVELLHMLEFHSSIHFPAAPLLTVILALVGLEAVLSEFFQDTAAAMYVIFVVWMADQYRSVCCSNPTIRKHWTRFFFLYHFFFYGYTFRFGHNLYLAFITSWLFILHSMMYFFHRYELPLLMNRVSNNNLNVNAPRNPPEPPAGDSDAGSTSPPVTGSTNVDSGLNGSSSANVPEGIAHNLETITDISNVNTNLLDNEFLLDADQLVLRSKYEIHENYSCLPNNVDMHKKNMANQLEFSEKKFCEKIMNASYISKIGMQNKSSFQVCHAVIMSSYSDERKLMEPKINKSLFKICLPVFNIDRHMIDSNDRYLSNVFSSTFYKPDINKKVWTSLSTYSIALESNFPKKRAAILCNNPCTFGIFLSNRALSKMLFIIIMHNFSSLRNCEQFFEQSIMRDGMTSCDCGAIYLRPYMSQ